MFKKKIVALSLCLLMVTSMVACKKSEKTTADATPTPVPTTAPVEAATPTPTSEPVAEFVGIDFEDGNMGFIALSTKPGNADISELSIVDFNGSKQLKVAPTSFKVPYLVVDTASLVGDKIAEVGSIEMQVTLESPDGTFRACSGNIMAYSGVDRKETKDPWSVYLETKNPNICKGILEGDAESFVAGSHNFFIFAKETDNGKDVVDAPTIMYIDNIVIRDKSGNAMAVDSAAQFDAPAGFADEDWSNLTPVKNTVAIEGFNVSGGAWAQAGVGTIAGGGTFDTTLLQPGTIITIDYTCEGGSVWLVAVPLEGAPFAWTRIQQQTAPKDDSNNRCQITYEQIVEALGTDDLSMLYQLQAEGDAEWSVTNVTIGVESKQLPATVNNVAIDGFTVAGAAWSQAGVDNVADGGTFDPAILTPGSVVTINYKSEGSVWLVAVPSDVAPFAWTRIEQQTAPKNDDNNKCQITYEQIVAALGTEDLSGIAKLQCEGDADWEVLSVTVGKYAPQLIKLKDKVEIEGFTVPTTGAWAQGGVLTIAGGGTFDPALIKPGCVFEISYNSTGNVWLVAVPLEGAPFGWTRIEQGTALLNGKKAQVTYDQLVAALGTEDFSMLYQLQAEGDAEWEVYSVSIGYPAE